MATVCCVPCGFQLPFVTSQTSPRAQAIVPLSSTGSFVMYTWLLLLALTAIARAAAMPMPESAAVGSFAAEPTDVRISGVTTQSAEAVTVLSSAQLSAFSPYTQFARAAYCPSSKLTNWNCGGMFCESFLHRPLSSHLCRGLHGQLRFSGHSYGWRWRRCTAL